MAFPIDEIQLSKTEARIGAAFPEGFRLKMMQENGGEFEIGEEDWFLYPFLDDSDRKRLSRTANDIVRETEAAREWRGFPPNGIAIAHNGDGDYLVFLIDAAKRDMSEEVFRWTHENGQLEKISSTFRDLI